jgi:hypothetical protein
LQRISLKVVGKRAEATLNGTLIAFCDAINMPEGDIGPRSEHGRFEWRDLKIKVLSPP